MRAFEQRPGRLARLPIGGRVLYSVWLAYALVALGVAATLMREGPTLSAEGAALYYAGSDGVAEAGGTEVGDAPALPALLPESHSPAGGPALDLPPSALPESRSPTLAPVSASARIAVEFNRRRLLEVTHGHLFMMPLFYLVIAHLFVLAGLRRAITVPLVLTGGVAIGAHMAAPWLIRSAPLAWAWLMPASGVAMLVSLGGMALLSLVVMWLPRRAPSGEGA